MIINTLMFFVLKKLKICMQMILRNFDIGCIELANDVKGHNLEKSRRSWVIGHLFASIAEYFPYMPVTAMHIFRLIDATIFSNILYCFANTRNVRNCQINILQVYK